MNKRLAGQLELVLTLLDEVLQLVRLELHDAADAQLRRPLALIEVTQDVFHVSAGLSCQGIALSLGRQVDKELLVIIFGFNFVVVGFEGEHALIVAVPARLLPTASAIDLTCTR